MCNSCHVVVCYELSGGPSALSATAMVEITVSDVNDVVPTLDRSEYSVAILENSVPGDVIADVGIFIMLTVVI